MRSFEMVVSLMKTFITVALIASCPEPDVLQDAPNIL
jgi:hypothetical protein